MQSKQLRGTGVAMVTPFDANNAVDTAALTKLTQHLIEGGVEYLVVLGTTGESVTLSAQEKKTVIATVLEANKGRIPVVLGMGGNNTAALLAEINQTNFEGIDAILSVTPYYNKPTQSGLYAHYAEISKASPVPILLYNVPGRTSVNLLPETVFRLANDFSNIIGIKEAAGNMEQAMQLINGCPNDFLVISGDDALTFPFVAAGGDGVISVVGNAYPAAFSSMVRQTLAGDISTSRTIHYQLLDIINQLFVEGNPAGIKAALKELGLFEDHIRLPLVKMSNEGASRLKQLMQTFSKQQISA